MKLLKNITFILLFSLSATVGISNDYLYSGNPVEFHTIQTSDGGYLHISAQKTGDNLSKTLTLMKTDTDGGVYWKRSYNPEKGITISSVSDTETGEIFILGHTLKNMNGENDIYMMKISSFGEPLFEKRFAFNGIEIPSGSITIKDKNILIYGYSTEEKKRNQRLTTDIFILLIDEFGNIINYRTYGLPDINETSLRATALSEKSIIIGGIRTVVSEYLYLLNLDKNLNKKWETVQKVPQQIKSMHLLPASNGSVLISAIYNNPTAESEQTPVYITKINQYGKIEAIGVPKPAQPSAAIASKPEKTKQAVINRSNVRMRSEPTLNSDIIELLDDGSSVTIIAQSDSKIQINDWYDYWYHIKTLSGKEGWIYGSFVNLSDGKTAGQ